MRGAIEARTPLQRLGRPEEVAATALFLASDAGAYLTGKDPRSRRGLAPTSRCLSPTCNNSVVCYLQAVTKRPPDLNSTMLGNQANAWVRA